MFINTIINDVSHLLSSFWFCLFGFSESTGELHLGPASELQNMRTFSTFSVNMTWKHRINSNTVSPSPAEGLEVRESRPSLLFRLTELGGRASPHAGSRIHSDTCKIPTAEVIFKTRYPSRTWWVIIIFWVSYYIGSCEITRSRLCKRTLRIDGLLVHVQILSIFRSLFSLWKPLHVRWAQTSARATICLALLSVCHQSKPTQDKQQSEQWQFCVWMQMSVFFYEPASGFDLCCIVDFFILPNILLLLSIFKRPDSLLRASLKDGRARLRDQRSGKG